ncbi:photosystem II protein Psb27 [Leptothoe spongobia]|uniref:Photosystem II lipoprotein Psb27 n=1 Tax=Leptothoe spongobia TAU-MAC 1115 TaxID=1967444 RepID=A0A947GJ25_9CYAN|nr:photosystem II protein Psb27 [Leptothoe spongobia]MBT9315357.1 photosystem II protein Psb27 [Leptothoe spongobia TAU-MAC 1115]
MKRILSRLFAFTLVAILGLTSCGGAGMGADGLSGNYRQDTIDVMGTLRTAIELPADSPNLPEVQTQARQQINAFAARYRRSAGASSLSSFATMQTALSALAGHYSSYPNRPIPAKLKTRLEQEFKQVEMALRREAA